MTEYHRVNVGDRFGRLVVIEKREREFDSNHGGNFLCLCDCGNKFLVHGDSLLDGSEKDCPILAPGSRRGKLTVLECLTPDNKKNRGGRWDCVCVCGERMIKRGAYLKCLYANRGHDCSVLAVPEVPSRANSDLSLQRFYLDHVSRRLDVGGDRLDFEAWYQIVSSPCVYCGGVDVRGCGGSKRIIYAHLYDGRPLEYGEVRINGIDRLDSDLGYIKDNIVSACALCNMMKGRYSASVFMDKVVHINKHIASGESLLVRPITPPAE